MAATTMQDLLFPPRRRREDRLARLRFLLERAQRDGDVLALARGNAEPRERLIALLPRVRSDVGAEPVHRRDEAAGEGIVRQRDHADLPALHLVANELSLDAGRLERAAHPRDVLRDVRLLQG